MLVVSRILAVFFTYRDNSAKPNVSRNFFQAIRKLKIKRRWGLLSTAGQQKSSPSYSMNDDKSV